MEQQAHTPGPWLIDERFPDTVRSASGTVVAIFDNANQTGNARLGAAAPELLEQAKCFEMSIEYQIARYRREGDEEGARLATVSLNFVRAAIAKAEGPANG